MLDDDTDVALDILRRKSTVRVAAGDYRGLHPDGSLRAVVDFDGGRVPAYFQTPWRPVVNDPVWVQVVDGVAWLMGPTSPRASDGTVVSVAGGIAVITTDVGEITATYEQGTTLTAGQQVKLQSHGGYHVLGVKSTSPVAPPPAPGGGGGGVTEVTQTFTAVDAGSFQGYWWTGRVIAGSSNEGVWLYDYKIPWTIPSTAQGVSIEIYLNPTQIQGANPIFTLHSYGAKPAGSPGLSGGTAFAVTGAGWYPLPIEWIDSLKAGGGAAGVGLNHGGYNIFASLAQDPQSGALRIRYRY